MFSALSTFGRLTVTYPIAPFFSNVMFSNDVFTADEAIATPQAASGGRILAHGVSRGSNYVYVRFSVRQNPITPQRLRAFQKPTVSPAATIVEPSPPASPIRLK